MVTSAFSEGYREFLRLLVAARKESGMTQQAVADKLGRPQSFVAKYEKGERRLDVVEFIVITRILGTTPQTILKGVERCIGHDAVSPRTRGGSP